MAVGVRFSVSFRQKIERAWAHMAGRASQAGAEAAKEYLEDMLSGWNRKPKITIKKSDIVASGPWKQLHAYLSVSDPVKIRGKDRFKLLDEGVNTSPNEIKPRRAKVMVWSSPYVSKTTGQVSGWGASDGGDAVVHSMFVRKDARKIAPMAFMQKILAEHKADIIQAMKSEFESAYPSSDY